MDEILKKIDEEINQINTNLWNMNTEPYKIGVIKGLNRVKELILEEQFKPLTIGDKIRESNESLAETLADLQHLMGDNTDREKLIKEHLSYLNQSSIASSPHQKSE